MDDNSADNCSSTTNAVIPLNTIPPSAFDSLVSLDAGSLALYYDLQPDIRHRLEISVNGEPFTTFNPLLDADAVGDTIRSLDMENNSYCFRVISFDPCQGFNIIANTSPVICNVLFDVALEDNVNVLNWSTTTPTNDFEFVRTGGGTVLSRPGLTGDTFDDTDIDCNEDYCYTLTANFPDGSIARSLERCSTSFRTIPPQAVDDLTVSVNDTNIELSWPENTVENIASWQILRGTNPGNLGSLATTGEVSFIDQGLNTGEVSYCYRVDATDECGNTNTSGVVACSMLLTGSIAPDNTVSLFWNDYEGWQNGISNYIIEKSYLNGDAPDLTSTVSELQETDNNNNQQVIIYRVQAIAADRSLTPAYSNTLMLIKSNNIYYPNAFTPDGNNLNDTFTVNGRFIEQYELRIFNRWGEEIFFSDRPEIAWDGTLDGKSVQYGAYAFKVEIVDQAGREITETGTVLLMRR